MKNKGKTVLRALDIFFDSLTFAGVHYLLLCCTFSFRANIAYVFFFALNVAVIVKYWTRLRAALGSKMLLAAVFVASFAAVGAVIFFCGYLEVATVFTAVVQ